MSRPQKRRSSEEWLTLINAQIQSGVSAHKFCQQEGISYPSFCKWKQRLSDESTPETNEAPAFVDLSSMTSNTGGWQIVLSLGDGVELKLNRL